MKSLILALGAGFCLTVPASAQIFISTGASSGLRMFAPNAVDWWLQPFSNQLEVIANGQTSSPLLTVLSGGNVGIGTTGPVARLNVVGSAGAGQGVEIDNQEIKFRGDGVAHYSLFANRVSGSLTIDNTSAITAMGAASLTSNLMTLQSGGNVGVGTTSPQYGLEVVNANGVHLSTTPTAGYGLFLNAAGSASLLGGNLGVGTTGPAARLNVVGSGGPGQGVEIDNQEIKFRGDGVAHYSLFANRVLGAITIDNTSAATAMGAGSLTSNLMTLQAGGNVGVGTTNPTVRLQVSGGDVRLDNGQSLDWVTPGGGVLGAFGLNSSSNVVVRNTLAGGQIQIGADTAPNIILAQSGGNVGIGTTAPTSLLDINNGSITVRGSGAGISIGGSPVLTAANGGAATSSTNTWTAYQTFDNKVTVSTSFYVSGGVGIGTPSPLYGLLDVNGIIAAQNGNYFYAVARYNNGNNGGILFNNGTVSNLILAETAPSLYAFGAGAQGAAPSPVLTLNLSSGNVGISSSAPQGLFVVGNGTMVVTSAGKIGIGTASPSETLQVAGGVAATGGFGTFAAAGTYLGDDGSEGVVQAVNASGTARQLAVAGGPLVFKTGTSYTERARIDQSGNVGIGTTGPNFKTDIQSDMTMSNDINPGSAQLSVGGATTPGKRMILGYDTNANGYGYIKAGNYLATWTNLALQPNGGNVGVGTTNPTARLQVSGGSVRLDNGQTLDWMTPGGSALGVFALNSSSNVVVRNTLAGGQIQIGADTAPNIILAQSGGSVGIGTTGPDTLLETLNGHVHLKRSDATGQILYLDNPANQVSSIRFLQSGTNVGDIRVNTSTNTLAFGQVGGGDGFTYNFLNGDVGIGTTSPAWPLHVIGNAAVTGQLSFDSSNPVRNNIDSPAADQLRINTAQVERVRINASGNVGIGTAGPTSLLDINNGSITVRGTNAGISINGSPVLTSAGTLAASSSTVISNGGISQATFIACVATVTFTGTGNKIAVYASGILNQSGYASANVHTSFNVLLDGNYVAPYDSSHGIAGWADGGENYHDANFFTILQTAPAAGSHSVCLSLANDSARTLVYDTSFSKPIFGAYEVK